MTTPYVPASPISPPPREPDPGQRTSTPLRRSRHDRILAGVCGGLGTHLGIDPILLRIAFVALTLAGGAGVLAYIIAWIVIPEAPLGEEPGGARATASPRPQFLVGAGLVVVGAMLLVRDVLPGLDDFFWPLVLIAIGAAVLLRGERS